MFPLQTVETCFGQPSVDNSTMALLSTHILWKCCRVYCFCVSLVAFGLRRHSNACMQVETLFVPLFDVNVQTSGPACSL